MQQVKNASKVAISFLARDCENSLHGFLTEIERLRSFFLSSQVYILENGSKDSTKDILKKYQASSASVILNTIDDTEFDILPRIEKMAKLRNAILDMVRNSYFLPDYYKDIYFLTPDGKPDTSILAPDIYALCARKYGFVYKDCLQKLGHNITIYPSSFVGSTKRTAKESNYAVHCCAGSWRERSFKQKLREMIKEAVNTCRK